MKQRIRPLLLSVLFLLISVGTYEMGIDESGGGFFQIAQPDDPESTTSWNTSMAYVLEITEWTAGEYDPEARMFQEAGKASGRVVAVFRGSGDFENSYAVGTFEDAVVRYMQKWTDPAFSEERIRVSQDELAAAQHKVDRELIDAIERSIAHVMAYQRHVMPQDVPSVEIDGATLGLRYTPVDSAALTVPGGTAVLFSTLVMLAAPAMVAGVRPEKLTVLNPPPTRRNSSDSAGDPGGDISPIVLATCNLLGIEKVYRIGGAQAVAAAAFGTQTVEPVDLIAGPGNVFVQLAKAQVAGVCGTDNGFYGPSEIVTIADAGADPRRVAADLIAQAEHDPGKCFLITWSRKVLYTILAEIEKQLPGRNRKAAVVKALENESCAIVASGREQAVELANRFAAEHVNLAVENPREMLDEIRHAGEVFLGDATPVAAGDYYAGPSHCLPTGTTLSLDPFPKIRAKPSSGSIAVMGMEQTSDTRKPLPYISSNKARSRLPSGVPKSGAERKRSISSIVRYSGRRRAVLGLFVSSVKSSLSTPSPTMYRASIRTAESLRDKLEPA